MVFSLLQSATRQVRETASALCQTPLCFASELAVVKLLSGLTNGCLLINTDTQVYIFPPTASPTAEPRAELTVRSPMFWLRLAAMGDIGFSEAFMYGDVDCSDLVKVFEVFLANSALLSALDSPLARLFRVPSRLAAARLVNSVSNARNNISAHYDISNDMFQAFLSKDMTYSCALFPTLDADLAPSSRSSGSSTPTTAVDPEGPLDAFSKLAAVPDVLRGADADALNAGQLRKLQHVLRRADVRPGQRVLEIGTGWGALAILLASTVPGATVDTLTLSAQQARLAEARIGEAGVAGRVRVHLMDYRSMPREWAGAFDRVVSVEMVEAVGAEYLETYWKQIDWALKKDTGVGVVMGITLPEGRSDAYVRDTDFIRKYVLFPGGFLPTLTSLINTLTRATSGALVVDSVSNVGPHYARTLREWRQRFEKHFEEAIVPALKREHPEVMGDPAGGAEAIEVFRRKWVYYFSYCEIGFTSRMLGDHIVTFTREGNTEYGCQTFE